MTPSKKVRNVIGGIIAKYQEIFGVEIYAYVFLTNHYHLIVRAPRGNFDEFAENVNREIARRINFLNQRRGKFWSRRYDDQEIKSEEDLLEAFLYVTTNVSRHGLLEDPAKWPGLHSLRQSLDEQDRIFGFTEYSHPEGPRRTLHTLRISILPQFKGLNKGTRRERISKLVNERIREIKEARSASNERFLSLGKLRTQILGSVPNRVSNRPRPSCYTKFAALRRQHRIEERLRRLQYSEASLRFRMGILKTTFPRYSFRPPLHRRPRIVPFKPLSPNHFQNAA
jgi:REP element-mobilizing transposase RayT